MTEHEKARRWRLERNLTVAELAACIGYSPESIYAFERGATPARTWTGDKRPPQAEGKIAAWVWLRYKNACRGVEHALRTGKDWDWA